MCAATIRVHIVINHCEMFMFTKLLSTRCGVLMLIVCNNWKCTAPGNVVFMLESSQCT